MKSHKQIPIVVSLMRSRPFGQYDGETFYSVIQDSFLAPLRFGNREPLQQNWDDYEAFTRLWQSELHQWFGMVLVKCRNPTPTSVSAWMPYGPKATYHSITLTIADSDALSKNAYSCILRLIDQIFQLLHFDYGYICYESEFNQRNLRQSASADGKTVRETAIGTKWPNYIPGLYWVNYFGDRYLESGLDVRSVPPSKLERLVNGTRLQLTQLPCDWQKEPELVDRTIEMLGKCWFFSENECREYLDVFSNTDPQFRSPPSKV